MKPILSAENLQTGYGKGKSLRLVSKGLGLRLFPGSLNCLVGPNGIGKSTLLRTLSRLQTPLGGHIALNGRPPEDYSLEEWARNVALVLTDPLELGSKTVYSLVCMGRAPHTGRLGLLSQKDRERVEQSLALTGMSGFRDRIYMELSDGQKQKVQISRALCQEPCLLILDEPTVFLDLPGRIEILSMLHELTRKTGLCVLMSTHELNLALKLCDCMYVMDTEGGLRSGSPEDLALEGAFKEIFENRQFYLEPESGEVTLRLPQKHQAVLEGEGPVRAWTEKALGRIGFGCGGQGSFHKDGTDESPPDENTNRENINRENTNRENMLDETPVGEIKSRKNVSHEKLPGQKLPDDVGIHIRIEGREHPWIWVINIHRKENPIEKTVRSLSELTRILKEAMP